MEFVGCKAAAAVQARQAPTQSHSPRSVFVTVAVAMGIAAGAVAWWLGATDRQPWADASHGAPPQNAAEVSNTPVAPLLAGGADPRGPDYRAPVQAPMVGNTDPLLETGLRDRLEAMLMEAGDVSDPQALKQRLAQLVAQHFSPDLATRALALVERYVDYRVALGALRAPQDVNDPRALRDALDARQKVRSQFFDDAEYNALFAREAELDRYTLARLEITRNTDLSAEQRKEALQDAEAQMSPERRAERSAATAHIAAAQQTATFNTQNTDERTRHAQRSAQYGEPAAQAMAQLDREDQNWQQRLAQYSQARTQQGDGAALQQLRQQLFTAQEQLRIDAALALRAVQPTAPGS